MKTYFRDDETGLYVRRNAEWVYIGNDIEGEPALEFVVMDYELDQVIKALQKVRLDIAKEEQTALERQHLKDWNEGKGIQDCPTLPTMLYAGKGLLPTERDAT